MNTIINGLIPAGSRNGKNTATNRISVAVGSIRTKRSKTVKIIRNGINIHGLLITGATTNPKLVAIHSFQPTLDIMFGMLNIHPTKIINVQGTTDVNSSTGNTFERINNITTSTVIILESSPVIDVVPQRINARTRIIDTAFSVYVSGPNSFAFSLKKSFEIVFGSLSLVILSPNSYMRVHNCGDT